MRRKANMIIPELPPPPLIMYLFTIKEATQQCLLLLKFHDKVTTEATLSEVSLSVFAHLNRMTLSDGSFREI